MDSLFDSPEKGCSLSVPVRKYQWYTYLSFKNAKKKGFAKFHKCVGYKTQYLVSYLNFASFASYIRQNNEFKINMTSPRL